MLRGRPSIGRSGRATRTASVPVSARFASSHAASTRAHDLGSARNVCSGTDDCFATEAASASAKSSPPSRESPADAWISITPSMISSTVTSNVPPPRSNTTARISRWRSCRPKASAAAVGSLMMRSTRRPAIAPASRVARRCVSSK